MDITPIRLDLDIDPAAPPRAGGALVRLPMLRQGTDQDFELSWLIDGGGFDFTGYGAVMTVRATVQDAAPLFSLTSAAGEIEMASGALTLKFAAAKTASLTVPEGLPRVGGPQIARWGHDIRLTQGAHSYPLAAGVICMQYAFTRS